MCADLRKGRFSTLLVDGSPRVAGGGCRRLSRELAPESTPEWLVGPVVGAARSGEGYRSAWGQVGSRRVRWRGEVACVLPVGGGGPE